MANEISALDDKYRLDAKRIYLTGTQALVRLPMMQRERDRRAGLKTAGFISGYRGSPLGGYDQALWRAQSDLRAHDITFSPGVNEDLAATAVWGSQQVGLFPGARVQGVFGVWYGKGPGVDRSADALKHANSAGTSRYGGVLALAGDDHGCQSSTLAHQSEQIFAAAMMPVINPASLHEYLTLGLLGFALSRYSGCWVGFKAISETVESSASLEVEPVAPLIATPEDYQLPPGGLSIRWPDPPLEQERRLHGPKLQAIAAFARANAFDRVTPDSPQARLGIAATGKAYLDLLQALEDLGIDDAAARRLGLRVYKIGLSWPLEAEGAQRFADGLTDVLVVEEKRAFVEDQLAHILFNLDATRRPMLVGKRDERGAPLLPSEGELTPALAAAAVLSRLERLGVATSEMARRLSVLQSLERGGATGPAGALRTPFFCSGCPHNTSTKVPEGSRALAGIGCHGMAMYVPSRRTALITHMGAEGANWIGQAPFTEEPHIFQNMGDGTYTHSGLLAIRAAVAAGLNVTYKILYNGAVAMTGGQPAEGGLSVGQIARQISAEGVERIAIVSDEPEKYPVGDYFPRGATVRHRRDLDALQRELREIRGVTALIYDQTCAAEKRRRRKRGRYPDPPRRLFINSAVCEGCGDCGAASNCISLQPLETEFGRKRRIDQSSCNKDFSCVDGFCPSFVTVHGGKLRARPAVELRSTEFDESALPEPELPSLDRPFNILIAGVGGAGVITMGAILAMAAHLEGKGGSTLDFTGLAQKNGAVLSHVRLAPRPEDLGGARIPAGKADVLLGCDPVVACSAPSLSRLQSGLSRVIVNANVVPTAEFVSNPDTEVESAPLLAKLEAVVGAEKIAAVDAAAIVRQIGLDGSSLNTFLLGVAWQKGLVPLARASLARAIALNGAAVPMNQKAFQLGRLVAEDPGRFDASPQPKREKTLEETIGLRAQILVQYQNEAYAERYLASVRRVEAAEKTAAPDSTALTTAFARSLFKLMAYKDEYEVARLYADPAFARELAETFEGNYRLTYHLAPPLSRGRRGDDGATRKRAFGPWMAIAFRGLAKLKFLRGTMFDPFGYSEERRIERKSIEDFERELFRRCANLNLERLDELVAIAESPLRIRGFGHVKRASADIVLQQWASHQ